MVNQTPFEGKPVDDQLIPVEVHMPGSVLQGYLASIISDTVDVILPLLPDSAQEEPIAVGDRVELTIRAKRLRGDEEFYRDDTYPATALTILREKKWEGLLVTFGLT